MTTGEKLLSCSKAGTGNTALIVLKNLNCSVSDCNFIPKDCFEIDFKTTVLDCNLDIITLQCLVSDEKLDCDFHTSYLSADIISKSINGDLICQN
jgi:hypothetical protein